uniref:Uncharacterized protein n=1 Tax=Erpetoichthys calabaricus TaxID=27687 RepID=A0A8C4SQK3_ERPCA
MHLNVTFSKQVNPFRALVGVRLAYPCSTEATDRDCDINIGLFGWKRENSTRTRNSNKGRWGSDVAILARWVRTKKLSIANHI